MNGMERCVEWAFAAVAIVLAWRSGMELLVAWYSGSEAELASSWWVLLARAIVFALAAGLVVLTAFLGRD